jgi:hypothetical protein
VTTSETVVEIHTASVCPRGGVDLTITVPDEVGRRTLDDLQSAEGMRAVAAVLLSAAERDLPDIHSWATGSTQRGFGAVADAAEVEVSRTNTVLAAHNCGIAVQRQDLRERHVSRTVRIGLAA